VGIGLAVAQEHGLNSVGRWQLQPRLRILVPVDRGGECRRENLILRTPHLGTLDSGEVAGRVLPSALLGYHDGSAYRHIVLEL
jgi:hypothetical protein